MEQGSAAAVNLTDSNEVKLTVTVVLNASFSWLEKPTKHIFASHVITGIVLGLIAVTAITVNVCLIISIFYSSNLKRVILNQFVSFVSISCILDCIVNIPFSVYYASCDAWKLGLKVCRANAAGVLLVNLMVTWSVCGMCIERWYSIYMRYPTKLCNRRLNQYFSGLVFCTGVLTITIPIASGLSETRAFPVRYSCSVAIDKDIYFQVIILALFCLPVLMSVLALVAAIFRIFKSIKNINLQRTDLSYAELFFEESHLWNEWRSCKFVALITIIYIILGIPHVFYQLVHHESFSKISKHYNLSQNNRTDSETLPITQITHTSDNVFFWTKYSFYILFPLTTFCLRKEIRRKLSAIMSLCKVDTWIDNNSIQSTSPNDDNPSDFLVPQAWRRRRLSSVTCLSAPIVFGKPKPRTVQFTDLSTGIAKWKANYDSRNEESKRILHRRGSTFFDDTIEDDEEFTEFMKYEDGTEEEINSTEEVTIFIKKHTTHKLTTPVKYYPSEKPKETGLDVFLNIRPQEESTERVKPRLSKSFNSHRTGNIVVKQRNYYLTYPKLPPNRINLQDNKSPCELLRILKSYQSKRIRTTCEILPRGTDELLDSPTESRDIVSL